MLNVGIFKGGRFREIGIVCTNADARNLKLQKYLQSGNKIMLHITICWFPHFILLDKFND